MLYERPKLRNSSFGSGESTAPSSNTSPVRINFAARRTVSGFIQFPEPRWSPAPHLDGQRWLSAGICHDWACKVALPRPTTAAIVITKTGRIFVLLVLRNRSALAAVGLVWYLFRQNCGVIIPQ